MKPFRQFAIAFCVCSLLCMLTACMSSVTVWPSFVDLSKKDVILRVDGTETAMLYWYDAPNGNYEWNVFQALDNGQVAPVPVRYTDKVAQIEDNLCHITECFVPDYGDHYIHLTYMSTDQDPLPSVSDSAFSTFYSYEIENGVARMYCFFAYIPEFSEGYTVYINQDAVVIN